MGSIERRLAERGLTLPEALSPVGNYQPVKVHGELAYVAGHAPMDGAEVLMRGVVGQSLSLEAGYEAARLTALSMLASLRHALGDLDRVQEWIRAVGYVHCAPGFDRNADVLNGFSDLIVDLWGDAGRHARSAPGQGPSPLGVPVIVDAIVAVGLWIPPRGKDGSPPAERRSSRLGRSPEAGPRPARTVRAGRAVAQRIAVRSSTRTTRTLPPCGLTRTTSL